MILIADSGSTKTDWICLDSNKNIVFDTQTQGLNPQILNYNNIEQRIINNFELYQKRKDITHLYFYGAGCGTEVPRKLIKKVFESIFDFSERIFMNFSFIKKSSLKHLKFSINICYD